MKILVAEDDPVTRESIETSLRREGFDVVSAENGEVALRIFARQKPDLLCLDIMMPERDGYGVCREIRREGSDVPILFLSAKNEEIDVVVGLELGADDFIRKPFGKRELIARVRAALRRAQARAPIKLSFRMAADLEIFPKELRAVGESGAIELTPREVAILEVLHRRPNEAVSRDDLLDECWGMDYFPESRTLDQHVSKLRQKIEADPENPTIIETVRGVGYRWRERE